MGALFGILSAFGLSGAAGLNAYIPLLAVAVLGRCGVLSLAAPYDVLASWWAIAIIAVFLVVEVVVDKVPGADHLNDIVQTFVRPAAGAILFAASAGVVENVHPALALGLGLVMAFSVHATKAAARPVVNASTVGFGAPVVSVLEDIVSAVATALAILAPFLLVILFGAGVYVAWRVVRARRAKSSAAVKRAPG